MTTRSRRTPEAVDPPPRRHGLTVTLTAIGFSVLAHLSAAFTLELPAVLPDLGIDLHMPSEIEFGLTHGVEADVSNSLGKAATNTEASPGAQVQIAAATTATRPPKKTRPSHPEPRRPPPSAPEKPAPHPVPLESNQPPTPGTVRPLRLPAGAQIALRVDIARIQSSPIQAEVAALLNDLPDWQALTGGLALDPLKELDRLLVASPNLVRSRAIIAGRTLEDLHAVERSAEQLAANAGVPLVWQERLGTRTARWHSPDPTPRLVALIGPRHFVICRPEDLERVLAIAHTRNRALTADGAAPHRSKGRSPESDVSTGNRTRTKQAHQGATAAPRPSPPLAADALLAMEEAEGLSLEVEGVERFVRQIRGGIPLSLRMSATELEEPLRAVHLRVAMRFDGETAATSGRHFWVNARDRYAASPLLAFIGMAAPLRNAKLSVDREVLHLQTSLSVTQTRLIIGYVRGLVRQPARATQSNRNPATPAGGATPSRAPERGGASEHAPQPAPTPVRTNRSRPPTSEPADSPLAHQPPRAPGAVRP